MSNRSFFVPRHLSVHFLYQDIYVYAFLKCIHIFFVPSNLIIVRACVMVHSCIHVRVRFCALANRHPMAICIYCQIGSPALADKHDPGPPSVQARECRNVGAARDSRALVGFAIATVQLPQRSPRRLFGVRSRFRCLMLRVWVQALSLGRMAGLGLRVVFP